MPTTYFQCKQFMIHQQVSAMKVCTDGCLFGAWVAEKIAGLPLTGILDIGTGTGLLSLMAAQKNTARIDAIELDEQAAEQAAENFELSKWKERLQVIHADARTVHLDKKYAFIISNPPFFDNDLKSADTKRNLALHSSQLSLQELLTLIKKHLSDHGRFAVLLPYHRKEHFVSLAVADGFFLEEEVAVKQTQQHNYFRSMLLFGKNETITTSHTIHIREGEKYSAQFTELLKDYYLNL